jgi:hypothetical protein
MGRGELKTYSAASSSAGAGSARLGCGGAPGLSSAKNALAASLAPGKAASTAGSSSSILESSESLSTRVFAALIVDYEPGGALDLACHFADLLQHTDQSLRRATDSGIIMRQLET